MRFTVQYPLAVPNCAAELRGGEPMRRFARAAEQAGFSALAFTDHPAPSEKWVRNGGHEAFDLTTALGFCAAATSSIALMPYAMILPLRNPLLAAKAIATLDSISEGRVILAAAVGYLRSEFAAVGADFTERNELFDEALIAMRGIWSGEDFRFEGRHFTALGQSALPLPPRRAEIPVWIAGNSARARQRAATVGEGWAALLIGEDKAATVRSAALPTLEELAVAIADLERRCEEAGRDPALVTIQLEAAQSAVLLGGGDLEEHRDFLGRAAGLGVSWFVLDVPATSPAEATEALERYGAEVIAAAGR